MGRKRQRRGIAEHVRRPARRTRRRQRKRQRRGFAEHVRRPTRRARRWERRERRKRKRQRRGFAEHIRRTARRTRRRKRRKRRKRKRERKGEGWKRSRRVIVARLMSYPRWDFESMLTSELINLSCVAALTPALDGGRSTLN